MGNRYSPFTILLVFVSALAVIRVFFASQIGLSADEAYYFQWSRSLAWSYPDHPPMVAWLIYAGTALVGDTELGVRCLSIIIGSMGTLLVYALGLELRFSNREALFAAILENILLMPAVGSLLITPDVPLAMCWIWATYLVTKMLRTNRFGYFYWLIFPASLACYAKHTGILIFIFVALSCIVVPSLRKHLKSRHPWLALGISVFLMLPWIWSEAQNGFPSVLHQSAHAQGKLPGSDTPIAWFFIRWLELLGGQIALLTPVLFFWCAKSIWITRKSDTPLIPSQLAFFLPILITFLVAIFAHPEQNWASLGHPIAPIVAMYVVRNHQRLFQLKIWMLAVAILFTAIAHIHAWSPFLPIPPSRDPITRLHGWQQINKKVFSHYSNPSPIHAIVCDNYGLAAHLQWHRRKYQDSIAVVGTNRRSQKPPSGTWLILDEYNDFGNFHPRYRCKRTTVLPPISAMREGLQIRVVHRKLGVGCQESTVGE